MNQPTLVRHWSDLPLGAPGRALVEASAGTGKTWTISALYVRLVLGHGGPHAFTRPLMPPDILVMTFTRAATRELSDRIRARLVQAAQWLRQADADAAGTPPFDSFLTPLLASIPPGQARADAAWRLAMAADAMDDAAVFTIDAWCQRVLREHAFDSGQLFDETLVADEQALRLQAVQDHWRQQVYPLSASQLAQVRECPGFNSVQALASDLANILSRAGPDVNPAGPGQAALASQTLWQVWQHAQRERADALAQLRAEWWPRAQAMQTWLADQTSTHKKAWNGRKLSASTTAKWIQALVDWAAPATGDGTPDGPADLPELTDTAWERFTPDGLASARADGAPPLHVPPEFVAFASLRDTLLALPSVGAALRAHAVACVAQRMAVLKARAAQFGFADMLTRLDAALAQPGSGERLRQQIRQQYPVALVDEFQDTSPLQYRLFDRIYDVAGAADGAQDGAHDGAAHPAGSACALLLIGDPKQSIYAFRGADIDSYLTARLATEGRHHVLGTNHRSSLAMVDAVNRLFAWREAAPGSGAFRYRPPVTDTDLNPLPFLPVAAQGRAEVLVQHGGQVVPALTVEVDTGLRPVADTRQLFAARCAEQVVAWLNDPDTGFAHTAEPGAPRFRRLRPADVVVLVRSGAEARAVRRALHRRGLASVYLSDRESVFQSPEAADLLHWLQAVAQPRDARLVRAGWATGLLGLSLGELAVLAHDDDALDARMATLEALHTVWQQRGVQAMLRQTLQRLGLPGRWLHTPDGERRLTNVLHLAELLQVASAGLDGAQALIRWLHAQTHASEGENDEQVVRLESDADLVQVITVHKSKGLEYPLVCLPFATSYRAVAKDSLGFVRDTDAEGRTRLRLHLTDDDVAQADEARLCEDLRLLYVALTRARHAVWLGFGVVKEGRKTTCHTHRSALGYLLAGDAEPGATDWWAAWCGWLGKGTSDAVGAGGGSAGARGQGGADEALPAVSLVDDSGQRVVKRAADLPGHTPLVRPEVLPALREPAAYRATFERDWRVGSFSALVRDLPSAVPDLAPRPPARADDEFIKSEVPPALDGQAFDAMPDAVVHTADPAAFWHGFVRGPLAGNFLHDQLEWLAGEGFALPAPGSPVPGRAGGADGADGGDSAAGVDGHTLHLWQRLIRRFEQAGHGANAPAIADWLARIVHHPLPLGGPLAIASANASVVASVNESETAPGATPSAGSVSLCRLHHRLPEMAFWLPAHRLDAPWVGDVCRAHILDALWPGVPCPALPVRQLHGMLMGFADLVFEHAGRYWVLDYKSNHLGASGAAYTPEAMAAEMARHRYDVQAALYMLALHRLLRSRLGSAYCPATHLGGAVYWFVRGLDGPTHGICLVPPVPDLLDTLSVQLDEPGVGGEPGQSTACTEELA